MGYILKKCKNDYIDEPNVIDVLSAKFNEGDTVDIEALWEKRIVPKNVGRVKLLAKGTLDKALNVDLQDYSLQAVKMIVLVGGTVRRAK